MPKIEKNATMKDVKSNKTLSRKKMYSSAISSYILAMVCLVISLAINAEYVSLDFGGTVGKNLIGDLIRAGVILLFFFFTLIALGNYLELQGQVIELVHLIVLIVITLILAGKDNGSFILTFLGIMAIMIYFYFLQPKVK